MANRAKKPLWTPPKIWKDETVYILGGGPSLLLSPLHLIENKRVLGVNDAFKLGAWVDACYFGDCKWWDWNKDEFKRYSGLRMTSCQRLYHIPFVKTWKRGKPQGVEEDSGYISWNGNSGLSAINVAYHLGAKKIVLLGFDMTYELVNGDKKCNWHTNHKSNSTPNIYKNVYIPCIPAIVEDLKRLEVDIVNASVRTEISPKLIQRLPLEECV